MIYKGNADPAKMTASTESKQLPEGAEISLFCAFVDGALHSHNFVDRALRRGYDGLGAQISGFAADLKIAFSDYNIWAGTHYDVEKLAALYKSEKEKLS